MGKKQAQTGQHWRRALTSALHWGQRTALHQHVPLSGGVHGTPLGRDLASFLSCLCRSTAKYVGFSQWDDDILKEAGKGEDLIGETKLVGPWWEGVEGSKTTQSNASRKKAELELDLTGCFYSSGLFWSLRHSPEVVFCGWKPGGPGGPTCLLQTTWNRTAAKG